MKRFCISALLIFTQILAFSFPYRIASSLRTNDTFADHQVHSILLDTEGFLWLGTDDGLGRYDGERLETITEGHAVGSLCLMDDTVYAGADNGLFAYDPESHTLRPVEAQTSYCVKISRPVTCLARHGSFLFAGTHGQGLFIFDTQKNTLRQRSIDIPYITGISVSNDGLIYVCDRERGIYSFGLDFEHKEHTIKQSGILGILCSGPCLWYITSEGISRVSKNGHISEYHLSGTPRTIIEYSDRQVAVGCDNGLALIDKEDMSAESFNIWISSDGNTVKGCHLLYKDDKGTLWIASPSSGLLYLNPNSEALFHPLETNQSLYICETSDRTIWIGTEAGILRLNTSNGTFSKGPLQGKCISTLLADGDDLWAKVSGEGIFKYNVQSHKLNRYANMGYDPAISKNTNGRIEIKSQRHSYIYNPSSDSFTVRTDDESSTENRRNTFFAESTLEPQGITSTCFSSDGRIYTAVENCVYESNPLSKEGRHYPFGNKVETLFCDKDGHVWVGTCAIGLWKLTDGVMEHIDIHNGGNNAQSIQSITQDNYGYIWVCSNLGISKTDPVTGATSFEPLMGRTMKNNHFLPQAAICASNGTLYFGCEKGIISFPSTDNSDEKPGRIIISAISFRNGEPPIHNLYRKKQIKLGYGCNSFSISFALPGRDGPGWNSYMYNLSGIDDKTELWTNESSATYSNLAPGRYEFTVSGRSSENGTHTDNTGITIIISPPWWKSPVARFLYLIAAVGLAALLGYGIKRRISREYHSKLQKQQEEMEKEAYRQKMSFFMGMVHEIRTPLTIMRLSMDKMLKGTSSADTLSILQENVDYMQSTIDGIFNYQKNDADGVHLTLVETDIVQICHTAMERMSEFADMKGIELCKDIAADEITAMVDEPFFTKILTNLLSNALKYAKHKVSISIRCENRHALITVSDDGPGVKDSEKEKIFRMFYKAAGDAIAEASGIGVGLAYSRQLAIAHNGSLTVADAFPEGAAFTLKIPIIAEVQNPSNLPDKALTSSAVNNRYSKARLVVVDDNVRLLDMLREELSEWYDVRTAQNGAEALDLVRNEDIDIIVSDVMMPVMDGNRFCQSVKEDISLNHIPFIMLTAKTSIDAKVQGMENGADAYIEKPFSIIQVHLQIENLLKLRAAYHDALKNEAGRRKEVMPQSALYKDSKFMEKINIAIEEHLSQESFSIDTLAGTVFMSKSTFFRKFKTVAGCSPNDYLKNYRLNRAAQMISEGLKINEAAEKVGFYSPSYFAKCFKAKFGVLPKEWAAEKSQNQ